MPVSLSISSVIALSPEPIVIAVSPVNLMYFENENIVANNLAERLEKVLMQNKSVEPQRILPALKSDLRDILREYAELNDDIEVEIEESEFGYNVALVGSIKRFKS